MIDKIFMSKKEDRLERGNTSSIILDPYIIRHQSFEKENAIMIGDCIDADVRGAMAFGMQAILFDEKEMHSPEEEIMVIKHLLELKNIL